MNPLKFMLKHFVLKKKSNFLLIIFLLINSISFSQVTAIDLQLAQKYFIDPSGIVVVPRGKSKFSLDD